MDTQTAAPVTTWENRRRRARELRRRHPFAREVLGLYLELVAVQEEAAALEPPEDVLGWAAARLVPAVVAATAAAGPAQLAAEAGADRSPDEAVAMLGAWLQGRPQRPVERYLARATMAPVLEARPTLAGLCPGPRDADHCPCCGAPPQLSWSAPSGDPLVSAPRRLSCSRCQRGWTVARSRCPACGEGAGARLSVLGETLPKGALAPGDGRPAVFPHMRIESCGTCRRYLLNVDLGRDPSAVPEVDELAAVPLDLFARERGLEKVTPNLMGF
jgi:hypothetical protein